MKYHRKTKSWPKLEAILEANHLYEIAVRRDSKKAVEAGGGVWVGIQEDASMPYKLVLFNAPSGSTLALKTSEVTADRVREKIQWHERLFAKGKK